ncbi:MAG: HEAT repeat domain-containing protein, partial [Myxococcota bacterium]
MVVKIFMVFLFSSNNIRAAQNKLLQRLRWLTSAATVAAAIAIASGVVLGLGTPRPEPNTAPPPVELDAPEPPPAPIAVPVVPPPLDEDATRNTARALIHSGVSHAEPSVRKASCDVLGDTRDRNMVEPLLAMVKDDPDISVRARAAWALSLLDARPAVPVLRRLYRQAEPALQVWYAEALHWLSKDRKAHRRLARLTRNDDLQVSFKAAMALAETAEPGDRKAIRALIDLLRRKDELPDRRKLAVILARLAQLGRAEAHEALRAFLDDDDEAMRLAAAEALARIGDDIGRETLASILSNEQSPTRNRALAAAALVTLGDYTGYKRLLAELDHKDPRIRSVCAAALQVIGERSSLHSLIKRSENDPDASVRIRIAAAILFVLGLDPVLLTEASVEWTEEALRSDDWSVRAAASRTVGDLPNDKAEKLLAQAIADDDARVRKAVIRSAARIKTPAAARTVATAMEEERDSEIQEIQIITLAEMEQPEPTAKAALAEVASRGGRPGVLALGALVALGEVERADALTEAYTDGRSDDRRAAIDAAVMAKNKVVVPTLKIGLDDSIFDIRFKAAEGLSRFKAARDRAVAVLEQGLSRSPDIAARAYAALQAFGVKLAGGKTSEAWVSTAAELLASPDPTRRRAALPTVAALSWRQATPLIQTALRDSDPEIKQSAVDLIEQVAEKQPEAARRLYKSVLASSDKSPALKATAKARLARLIPEPEPIAATPEPAPVEPGPIAKLDADTVVAAEIADPDAEVRFEFDAASQIVDEVRARLDSVHKQVTELGKQLAAHTTKEAADEKAVDRVEDLREEL